MDDSVIGVMLAALFLGPKWWDEVKTGYPTLAFIVHPCFLVAGALATGVQVYDPKNKDI